MDQTSERKRVIHDFHNKFKSNLTGTESHLEVFQGKDLMRTLTHSGGNFILQTHQPSAVQQIPVKPPPASAGKAGRVNGKRGKPTTSSISRRRDLLNILRPAFCLPHRLPHV